MTYLPKITRLLLLFPLCGCADGGEPSTPKSEVIVAANHHMFWFRGLPDFSTAPTRRDALVAGGGMLTLRDDSQYTITVGSSPATTPQRYALASNAGLYIYQSGSDREPTDPYPGAYQLLPAGAGDRPEYFFADRQSTTSSRTLGLYYGLRVKTGQDELAGDWRLFSVHVMLQSASLQTPRTVARAAHGPISVAAGNPGSPRPITGSGFESGSDPTPVPVTLSGTVANDLDGQQSGNGLCSMTLGYTNPGSPTDDRVFPYAAAGRDVLFGVDSDRSDTASGMAALVRRFDPATAPAVAEQIIGTYWIGGMTFWVNPASNGCDSYVGQVTLSSAGFRLDAVGSRNIDFSYQGTYTVADDGAITIQVNGNGGEQWHGAISRTYDTLVIVDPVVEARANNRPELNYLIGVRKR